jgi:uracil-DNA glycosylase
MSSTAIHPSWLSFIEPAFKEPYMQDLKLFLLEEKKNNVVVYPHSSLVFNALIKTPLTKIKVVILGQDPYHGFGQAHGLAFSVPKGIPFPPSLQNIFKELSRDLNIPFPRSGDLSPWAEQGVFLLNSTLTVREGQAGSHQNKGWEVFTDYIISLVNSQCENVVFMLWGKFAQDKISLIDTEKHFILKAPHPSPLSAYRGFIGCSHFSDANTFLKNKEIGAIDWDLSKF